MAYITAGDQHDRIINTEKHTKVLTTGVLKGDVAIYMHHAQMVLCGGGGLEAPHMFFASPDSIVAKGCPIIGAAHYRTDADFCSYAQEYPGIADVCKGEL